jgi:hypothetical protein
MTRKSKIVSLGILGAVAASLGVCCCGGMLQREEDIIAQDKKDGGHAVRHTHRSTRFFPLFLPWGGGSRTLAPTGHPTSRVPSSTPRGGFGATGHGAGGHVGIGA